MGINLSPRLQDPNFSPRNLVFRGTIWRSQTKTPQWGFVKASDLVPDDFICGEAFIKVNRFIWIMDASHALSREYSSDWLSALLLKLPSPPEKLVQLQLLSLFLSPVDSIPSFIKMRFQFPTLLAIGSATLSFAHPASEELEGRAAESKISIHRSPRPVVKCSPKVPANPPRTSPPRNRTCYVESYGDSSQDDSEYVLAALNSCNNGGHVVFKQGINYTIGTALDLTFLNHIDIGKLLPIINTPVWIPKVDELF